MREVARTRRSNRLQGGHNKTGEAQSEAICFRVQLTLTTQDGYHDRRTSTSNGNAPPVTPVGTQVEIAREILPGVFVERPMFPLCSAHYLICFLVRHVPLLLRFTRSRRFSVRSI